VPAPLTLSEWTTSGRSGWRAVGLLHRQREQASAESCSALSEIVPSDRLAGTAGDARISERAGAESREGIPYIHGL
jgi:hypothetical protein